MTQEHANRLIAIAKHCTEVKTMNFPSEKGKLIVKLQSSERDEFEMSVYRGRIEVKKCTYQTICAPYPLIRVDLGNNIGHRNPDNTVVLGSHIHLYQEGYGLSWATPLPDKFTNPTDMMVTLSEFMDYCNIVTRPTILRTWDM